MRLFQCLTIVLMVLVGSFGSKGAAGLVVYTEDYPPFNHALDSGEVVGLSTEKVRQVMDASGLAYSIKLVPWARAVLYAQTKDNALIYSIIRTPAREAEYDWLVPLAKSNFYLFTLASEMRPVTRETIAAGHFTAACVTSDLACELIRWAGFPEDKIIAVSNSQTGDFRMVLAGRADIYVSNIMANARLRQQDDIDPAVTKAVLRLSDRAGFHLASGLHVPAEIRSRIRAAYEKLVAEGAYELADAEATPPQ